jgi:hypothetical protein
MPGNNAAVNNNYFDLYLIAEFIPSRRICRDDLENLKP